MLRRIITGEIAGFMVRVIEIASIEFYDRDRALAFKDLNEKMIWHKFVEKYEEKRGYTVEMISEEIREAIGREKTPPSSAGLINDEIAELIRVVVKGIAKKYNWNYSVSLERFYGSRICGTLSDAKIDLSSFSVEEVLELFHNELDPKWL
jgi:hypothetical protein